MEIIHMVGYDAWHPSDFIYDGAGSFGKYLLILTSTPMRFWENGEWKMYQPHQAVLFAPDSKMKYGACIDHYGNDWMIFSTDEPYITNFPIIAKPFAVKDPDYIHRLFQLITWEYTQDNDEVVLAELLSILFQKLRTENLAGRDTEYYHELLALRRSIINYPRKNWNVSDMAADLHISSGYLQSLYKQQFGISCIDDVIQNRIRLAKEYLLHTSLPVGEVASLCGYNSTEHFSRQFRRLCGMPPGRYRQQF